MSQLCLKIIALVSVTWMRSTCGRLFKFSSHLRSKDVLKTVDIAMPLPPHAFKTPQMKNKIKNII